MATDLSGSQLIFETETILKRPSTHCDCCGVKNPNLIGPLKFGPYNWVCNRCHDWKDMWYETKLENTDIDHNYGTATIEKVDFINLPNGKPQNILLVEPDYYSRFPPLGLLKIATYHINRGDNVELIRVKEKKKELKKNGVDISPLKPSFKPNIVYVTSLFTWSWKPVWEAVHYYRENFKKSQVYLGGIYASILPDHASLSGAHKVHSGLADEIDNLMPAYDLVPEWDGSILFATRGCVRRCSFCVVPKVEGSIKNPLNTISPYLSPFHTKAVIWDNNILASPNKDMVFEELKKSGMEVDFNQGIDARLVTPEIAQKLSELRIPLLHLAYDTLASKRGVKNAIDMLKEVGFRGRQMMFYTLYNHKEGPERFLTRLKDLMRWGVVSYPMRFEPLTSLNKNQYVSDKWTEELLEMVATARRVIGRAGCFPPYRGLVKKILRADTLYEAMKLRNPS